MNNIYMKIAGYPRWGQILGVIAKLRWFEENNYLVGFCYNNGYDYDEIKMFLNVSQSIINGDSSLYADLKREQSAIKKNCKFDEEEIDLLESVLT
ncbi:hypothetical protein F8154_04290 [Alkaliphilus pronyensis]|uniref:Uncharacterized protein n=1 Tax=Alkaliphilus pronyensis TaxID=1482732 RepID=A0A6I0F4K4_9FIRM|nr:hypothetical protein [Alkaliphilus pronyensis]KAB3536302.1 hypothetical protein F8154_04290 [Alkaliphilus pronyensis]